METIMALKIKKTDKKSLSSGVITRNELIKFGWKESFISPYLIPCKLAGISGRGFDEFLKSDVQRVEAFLRTTYCELRNK
jgi:hypothetical protein